MLLGGSSSSSSSLAAGIGAGIAVAVIVLAVVILAVLWYRRKRTRAVGFAHGSAETIELESMQGLIKRQLHSNELDRNKLVLGKEIGQGEFGVVVKAVGLQLPGCEEAVAVAVKILKQPQSEANTNAFIREGVRLRELDHANVIRLLGVCVADEPLYIVLEYMTYGDLKTILRQCQSSGVPLKGTHLLSFALDASRGFQYLQEKAYVHRDLAARNVLVSASFTAKIGDFGMARRSYRSEYYAATGDTLTGGSLVLPMRWMAPESYFDGTWDLKSDVWMFGVLLWGL